MASTLQDPPPDVNRGYTVIIIQSVFLTLAFVSVSIRLYVRTIFKPPLWWDDCFMVLDLVR